MTDQEIKDLVTSLALRHQELVESQIETNQQLRETSRQVEETDRRLQETVQETGRQMQETGRRLQEIRESADRELCDLKQQLSRLGQKFGGFTEGMAFPSMQKILWERFGMNVISPRVIAWRDGGTLELDVLAYSNSSVNEAYVVELKSHLRQDGLEQIKNILQEFHRFFPEHADKKVYGVLAAVDVPEDVREKVLKEGIYLARIHDDEFELQVPDDFKPRAF